MKSFHIRRSKEDDIPQLADIERRASRLFPVGRIPHPDRTFPLALLKEAHHLKLLFVAVADSGNNGVGFAVCHIERPYLHLDEVSVHPNFARRGIGRKLVGRIVEESIARHLAGTTLTTFRDLPWNGPFYLSMGFRILRESEMPEVLKLALVEEADLGMIHRVAMVKENFTESANCEARSHR